MALRDSQALPDVVPYHHSGTRSWTRLSCLADRLPVHRTPAQCHPHCPWRRAQTDTHMWHLHSLARNGDAVKQNSSVIQEHILLLLNSFQGVPTAQEH